MFLHLAKLGLQVGAICVQLGVLAELWGASLVLLVGLDLEEVVFEGLPHLAETDDICLFYMRFIKWVRSYFLRVRTQCCWCVDSSCPAWWSSWSLAALAVCVFASTTYWYRSTCSFWRPWRYPHRFQGERGRRWWRSRLLLSGSWGAPAARSTSWTLRSPCIRRPRESPNARL